MTFRIGDIVECSGMSATIVAIRRHERCSEDCTAKQEFIFDGGSYVIDDEGAIDFITVEIMG